MTEKEAIKILANFDLQVAVKAYGAYQSTIGKMACNMAIQALEEIQQYREIGTVEECREARERQNPEKVIDICGALGEKYGCPECGSSLDDTDLFAGNCKWCGQKLCK